MASDKIRLGVIGRIRRWDGPEPIYRLVASPDIELTAVCTTRQESAWLSPKYGARWPSRLS
jgi:hypothetical protein